MKLFVHRERKKERKKENLKLRFSNIELLRIISMLMVILSHYYCHGNFPEDSFLSANKIVMQLLSCGGKIAVDIFVIISGYFLVTQKFSCLKLSKFLSTTYFWSLSVLIFSISLFGIESLRPDLIQKSLIPITPISWFARAYLHLYLIFPLLNKLIYRLEKKKLLLIISSLLIVFFVVPTIKNVALGGYGNSLFMFSCLYFIGAYLRLYTNDRIEKNLLYIGILGLSIIWSSVIIFDYLGLNDTYYTVKANIISFPSSGANIFVLFAALGLFVYFKRMSISYNNYINTIAATTFAIYLIHDNSLINDWLWNKIICGSNFYHSDFLVVHMVVSCIAIFIVCSMLDLLRINYIEKAILSRLFNK